MLNTKKEKALDKQDSPQLFDEAKEDSSKAKLTQRCKSELK